VKPSCPARGVTPQCMKIGLAKIDLEPYFRIKPPYPARGVMPAQGRPGHENRLLYSTVNLNEGKKNLEKMF
jgi:hypothetical protein